MSTVVTDTRVARSADGILALPERALRRPRLAFASVLALAAAVYLFNLGSSSFFMDEVFSWSAARYDYGAIMPAVRGAEVTPPAYYFLLHTWMLLTDASSETMLRLPSALCGIALVGAVSWLGTIVGDRRVGLTAGVLTALSPLVLSYAQMVRAYVFLLLAVTLVAIAIVKLVQHPQQRRWVALAIAAGVAAMLLHYTAALVLAPMGIWLLRAREVHLGLRLAIVGAFALPGLALLPLLSTQLAAGHHDGVTYSRITSTGLMRLVATPFDGRAIIDMMPSYQLGLIALVDGVALLALVDRFRAIRARWLIVSTAALPVVAVVLVSALINPFAITRYTAVATPFMILAIAVAVWHVHRAIRVGILGAALVACVMGVAAANLPKGEWPDIGAATQYAGERSQPGDLFVGLPGMQYGTSNDYYDDRYGVRTIGFDSGQTALLSKRVRKTLRRGDSVFMAAWPPVYDLAETVGRAGYEVRSTADFGSGTWPVRVVEVVR